MRGFFLGLMSLAVLEAALSSPAAAGRTGTLLALPGTIARYVISPTVPAIPDLRKHPAAGTATSTDNPFAQAQANQQIIAASWTTSASAPTTTTTAPLSPLTIGV